jgi:hypothetical protein
VRSLFIAVYVKKAYKDDGLCFFLSNCDEFVPFIFNPSMLFANNICDAIAM